ncbi:DUF1003 domain-containing protein [Undibacterium arcticum]
MLQRKRCSIDAGRTARVITYPIVHHGPQMKTPAEITEQYLGTSFDAVDASTQLVARHLAARKPISRKPWKKLEEEASLGQRAADRVAKFGGSWTFIMIFGGVMVVWVVINSVLLRTAAFDPYPYILLNLFLSMLASIQAPVILMSQKPAGRKRTGSMRSTITKSI